MLRNGLAFLSSSRSLDSRIKKNNNNNNKKVGAGFPNPQPRKASSPPLALSSLTPRPAYLVRSYPVKRFPPSWPRGAFRLASQEEVGSGCEPLGAEPDKPGHEELASLLAISSNFFQALIPWGVGCGAGTKMRKSRVYRMVLATCLGSLLLVIFYFQSSLNPAAEDRILRISWHGKSGRSPLQTLYKGDQLEQSSLQATHQHRRELLSSMCHRYTRKRRLLTPDDLRHLVVDDVHEMLYCYVPKVACTNWKRVLMVLTGKGKYQDPLEIPAHEAHVPANLRTLSEYSTPEINYRLRNYLKFIFVREPLERLVSAYRNKFTRSYNTAFHKRYGTKIIRRHRQDPSSEALENGHNVRFEEFVYYLLDPKTQREEPFNEHWERVHSLCHPCIIHYDIIGKYETLADDANYILQLVGADAGIKFPSSSKAARTNNNLTAKFFKNISPFYQRRLFNLYKMDYLLFNYTIPSYLHLR